LPLIGTISGSNGTTTTAVTGSLVIANRPNSQFPTLPSDASLYISGVVGGLGVSGVTVVGGDLRVSGSAYLTDLQLTGHGALILQPYGTNPGQTGEIRFQELAANGGNFIAFKAPDSINPNVSLTLPSADGLNKYVLKTDGAGTLAFAEVSTLLPTSVSITTLTASNLRATTVDLTGSVNYSFSNTGSLGAGAYGNFLFDGKNYIGVDTRVNVYTGTLPVIDTTLVGRTYTVKDIGGYCATNSFSITASSPNKIDGATELKLLSNYASVTLIAGYDPQSSTYNWYIVGLV
jgi:hypothetical protein